MRILLIQSRFKAGNTHFPPLGLLSIATVLKDTGHEVRVLDGCLETDFDLDEVKTFNPDLVGFSFLTSYYQTTKKASLAFRALFPNSLFCAGGNHPSALPERTLRDMPLDFIVIGEGEKTILEVAKRLQKGHRGRAAYKRVQGVAYIENGLFVQETERPLLDIEQLPIPNREFLEFNKYITFPGTIKGKPMRRSTSVLVSRGCPFDCIFCGSALMWRKQLRFRTPAQAVEEVNYLHDKWGITGIYFADTLLTANRKWIFELCDRLTKLPFNISWACNSRVDTISDEMARRMQAAGCIQVDFGVESGSSDVLKLLRKKSYPGKAVEAFNIVRRHGLRTGATFIIGTPGETLEQMETTFKLARKLKPNYVCFNYMTPYPGTFIYTQAIQKNWIPKDIFFDEAWITRQAERPILTVNIPEDILVKTRNRFNRAFFFRNHVNLLNIYLGFVFLLAVLQSPKELAAIVMSFVRSSNVSKLLNDIATLYQQNTNLKHNVSPSKK